MESFILATGSSLQLHEAFTVGHIVRVYTVLAQGEPPGRASCKCHVQLLRTKEMRALKKYISNAHYIVIHLLPISTRMSQITLSGSQERELGQG